MKKLGRILTIYFKASEQVIKDIGEEYQYNFEKEKNLESSLIYKREFEFHDQETNKRIKKELDCVRKEYYFKSYKDLVNDTWFLNAVKNNKNPILNFKITDDNEKWTERKTIKPFMFPFSETSINILKCLDEYLYLERMGFDLVYTKTKNAKQTMKRVHYWGSKI